MSRHNRDRRSARRLESLQVPARVTFTPDRGPPVVLDGVKAVEYRNGSPPGLVFTERGFRPAEPPSRLLGPPRVRPAPFAERIHGEECEEFLWENDVYYGRIKKYDAGFPIGGGPYAVIGVSSRDETARHDWRDLQALKNALLGPEWEAVELYPAESRLIDPSNYFYLWAVPGPGVFAFGLPREIGRRVVDHETPYPQRPFPVGHPDHGAGRSV